MSKSTSEITAVYSELFAYVPSRAQKRMLQIVKGAIKCYASLGIEGTTYDRIAKTCKISRPLIQHYFKDRNEIFEMAMKYIRMQGQQAVVAACKDKVVPREKLAAYIEAHFNWLKKKPSHWELFKIFYYYCGSDPGARILNTQLVGMGHDRITAFLSEGAAAGDFAKDDLSRRAKDIQVLLTGALLMVSIENLDDARFRAQIVASCLRIAREP